MSIRASIVDWQESQRWIYQNMGNPNLLCGSIPLVLSEKTHLGELTLQDFSLLDGELA